MGLILCFQDVKKIQKGERKKSNTLQKSLFPHYYYKKNIKVLGQKLLKKLWKVFKIIKNNFVMIYIGPYHYTKFSGIHSVR